MRPYLSHPLHQCAYYYEVHDQSETRDKSIWMRQSRKRFECYIDASHVEHWEHQSAVEDPSMALS
jgi:hypothetical protein